MNWQCPRCETFNRTAEKRCEVCELAKPRKRAATKTAVKDTSLTFFPPQDSMRSGDALTKPAEKSGIKITDRRSGALTKSAGDDKSAASKSSASPTVSTSLDVQPRGSIPQNAAIVLCLLWIAGNIYLIYDSTLTQKIGAGSWIWGIVTGNIILLVVLSVIAHLSGLANPPKPPE